MSNHYGLVDSRGKLITSLSHLAPGDAQVGQHLVDLYSLRECEERSEFWGWYPYACGWERTWRVSYLEGRRERYLTGCEHALFHRVDGSGRRLATCALHMFKDSDWCEVCLLHYSDLYGDGSKPDSDKSV